jgi:hypothetical protein
LLLGETVGDSEGDLLNCNIVGINVGAFEDGCFAGERVGVSVCASVLNKVGSGVGCFLCSFEGFLVGLLDGCVEGFLVGRLDGFGVATIGICFSAGGIHEGMMDGLHPIESSPGVGLGLPAISKSPPGAGFGVNNVI